MRGDDLAGLFVDTAAGDDPEDRADRAADRAVVTIERADDAAQCAADTAEALQGPDNGADLLFEELGRLGFTAELVLEVDQFHLRFRHPEHGSGQFVLPLLEQLDAPVDDLQRGGERLAGLAREHARLEPAAIQKPAALIAVERNCWP